ncbi:MAG: hypothetical protein ACXQTF_01860 [Candidatus Hecatellaceae archaeon]
MAEKYLKAVQKVLNKGSVYFKLHDTIYRVKAIEIKGSNAKFECENLQDGEDYEISFKIEKNLMVDLLRFGLKDKPDQVFMISEDLNRPIWFETTLDELIRELEEWKLKKGLKKELAGYKDIEEG